MKRRHVLTAVTLAGACCMILPSARAQKSVAAKDAQAKKEPAPRLPDGHPDFSAVWYQARESFVSVMGGG